MNQLENSKNDELVILQYTEDMNLNKEKNEKTLEALRIAREERQNEDVSSLLDFKL